MPPQICPNCGASVPRDAKACPECGSDETTGWSDDAAMGGLGLPDEEFDYENFVKREFEKSTPVPRGISPFWWVVAALMALLMLVWWFRW